MVYDGYFNGIYTGKAFQLISMICCCFFPKTCEPELCLANGIDFFLLQWIKIISVCILSFGPSLVFFRHDFVFDDGAAVVKNPDVTNKNESIMHNIRDMIGHDFWGQNITDKKSHKSFRPVITLMFHLEYRYFEQLYLPAHMKRVNLLLHIIVCCVLYDVLKRIFMEIDHSIISNAILLFAAHPIHTEVICSVVGRADLVCAFFFLTTFNQFLDFVDGLLLLFLFAV